MAENETSYPRQGQVTVTVDHSAVEMQERERADKIQKEFNDYKASIEAEKAQKEAKLGR